MYFPLPDFARRIAFMASALDRISSVSKMLSIRSRGRRKATVLPPRQIMTVFFERTNRGRSACASAMSKLVFTPYFLNSAATTGQPAIDRPRVSPNPCCLNRWGTHGFTAENPWRLHGESARARTQPENRLRRTRRLPEGGPLRHQPRAQTEIGDCPSSRNAAPFLADDSALQ